MNFREKQYCDKLAKITAKADILQDGYNAGIIPENVYMVQINKYIFRIKELIWQYNNPPRNTPKIPSMQELLNRIQNN